MKRHAIAILLLLVTSGALAGGPMRRLVAGADSLLRKIYMRADYDTAYIERSPGIIGLKGWGNVSGLNFYGRGHGVKADLETDKKATLSFELDYYDLALEVALNPASLAGRSKDYEFNLNLYSTRFSLEASYQIAKTLAGDIRRDDKMVTVEKGWLHTKILNLAAFYTFNYRHFSYDAPFYQLYKQKRSAGSWLAGFSYQGGNLKTSEEYKTEGVPASASGTAVANSKLYTLHSTPSDVYIAANHLGLGGGYAYNHVGGSHWLLHLSAIPSLIVWSQDKITLDGERRYVDTKFPTIMFNARASAVYFFNSRHFLGLCATASNLVKYNDITGLRQNKWLARLFYGVRL